LNNVFYQNQNNLCIMKNRKVEELLSMSIVLINKVPISSLSLLITGYKSLGSKTILKNLNRQKRIKVIYNQRVLLKAKRELHQPQGRILTNYRRQLQV